MRQNVYFADENLFDVFTVKVLKGNPKLHCMILFP